MTGQLPPGFRAALRALGQDPDSCWACLYCGEPTAIDPCAVCRTSRADSLVWRMWDDGTGLDPARAKALTPHFQTVMRAAGVDPGRYQVCGHCGYPTAIDPCTYCATSRANAARWSAPRGDTMSSSGRGPSPAERQAFLDARMPLGERIRLQERAVAIAEHDSKIANERLRDALARVQELLPAGQKIEAPTLDLALSVARRDASGRALPPDLADRYRDLFDAADRWHRAERAQQAARSRQAALLGPVQARSSYDDGYRHPAEGTGTRWDPLVRRRGAR